MDTIELQDVQGYVFRAYGNMQFSRFALLKITNAEAAKRWISAISSQLTNASIVVKEQLPETCLNIAFAPNGLKALGLSEKNINTFSPPFKEGMTTVHRTSILGDIDSSSPENWFWGGLKNEPVELALLVFGKDKATCLDYFNALKIDFEKHGLEEHRNLDGISLKDNKEHFGFRDGIAQPIVRGSGRTGPEHNTVNAGEFILGYKNNYKVYPDSPTIAEAQGNMDLLPPSPLREGKKDLGKNGSYFIVRQMQQDVEGFWNFMNDRTRNDDGAFNEEASIKLASKMMGRWPSGSPISKFPDKDPGGVSDNNDFLYAKDDPKGLKCPFGSHARRMNPRDSFETDSPKKSLLLSNRHRLIRRARAYGDPIVGAPNNNKPKGDVGLYFNCFSADISRQFEFLQYTWSNYPKIKELYSDPDPIIGVVENPKEDEEQQFTLQGCPINKTEKNLKRFVTIKGGAYFFFPSITTIRYLCSL
ncbi:Dyp-type peroxidase [Lacinutrix sp. Bg11-31]|uniref:Dyp-type peroxidase n=1 Tax=Lacinutrix sp. Bg11-31 TaxID=2057808 RepID=UPI000C300B62|nr:Dyp-type peroxidase [Lacinutrix sp. Bg11-31]AUC80766.1 peroxidase [Lacinutrix sp. Bg11-31]